MRHPEASSRHCYSVRLLRPFAALLRKKPGFPHEVLQPLDALDPDERVPIVAVHELLRAALELTGDPDLGLEAAREIQIGDYGALEYVASSAATVGGAFEVISRYLGLVNDALTAKHEVAGDKVLIRLESAMVLPRAAADFQSAAFYVAATQRDAVRALPASEIWFTHPKPEDTSEYARTFPGQRVRFDMPWNGFVLDAATLAIPLTSADPKLHELIRRHAEQLLSELPGASSFTDRVRKLIAGELAGGDPTAGCVAKKLHLSARTLARRLEDEGTSFKELLDDLRRRSALRYVGGQDLDISEVAFLLGFSETSAFYRAFKRWTGQTPLGYRRERRG